MLLRVEAVALIALAVLLAAPVPTALARARWTLRSPRAALILWQAVGLGGGLAILGAGLTLAAGSASTRWLPGIAAVARDWPRLGPDGWAGVVLTATMGAWLAVAAAGSTVKVVLARRAHRRRLDTVADTYPARALTGAPPAARSGWTPGGTAGAAPAARPGGRLDVHLVEHPGAVAYCLPGLRPRVVISRGAVTALDRGQLTAVLAHERAHARGRHDLVVQPFLAWRATFPFLPAAWRAAAAVELLVEVLADDAARRDCGAAGLRLALGQLAAEHRAVTGRDDPNLHAQLATRSARLAARPRPLPAAVRALVYAAAAALVLTPPVILALS